MKNYKINIAKNLIVYFFIFTLTFPFNFFLSFKKSNNVNVYSIVYADDEDSDSEEFEKLYVSSLLAMLGITFDDDDIFSDQLNDIISSLDEMQRPFIEILQATEDSFDIVDFEDGLYQDIFKYIKSLPKNVFSSLKNFVHNIEDSISKRELRIKFKKYAQEHFLRMTFKDTYDLMKLQEMGKLDDYYMFKEYSKFYLTILKYYLESKGVLSDDTLSPDESENFVIIDDGNSDYYVYHYPTNSIFLSYGSQVPNKSQILTSNSPFIGSYRYEYSKSGFHDFDVWINEEPVSIVIDEYNEFGTTTDGIYMSNIINNLVFEATSAGFEFNDGGVYVPFIPIKIAKVENNRIIGEFNTQIFMAHNHLLNNDFKNFILNYDYELILAYKDHYNSVDKELPTDSKDDYKIIPNRDINYIYNYNTINNFTENNYITNNYYQNGEDLEKKLDNFIDSYKKDNSLIQDYLKYLKDGIQNLDDKVTRILEDGLFIGDIDELADKLAEKIVLPDMEKLNNELKVFIDELLNKKLLPISEDIGFIKKTVITIKNTTDTILTKISTFSLGDDSKKIVDDLKEKDENGKSLWDKIKDFFKDFGNFFKGIFDFFKNFFTITEKFDLHKINTEGLGNKIPFSIFSDISNLFKSFLATPEAPVFSFKLITVPVTIDFNNFAELGKIIRVGSFVFFVFFLVTKFYNKVA